MVASSGKAASSRQKPSARSTGTDQNRKGRRGRPLKETNDGISEQRRAQVRRAQETFRRRKQVATESLEQRVASLEDCVEQMSHVFLDFTNSVLDSENIRNNQELGQHLFAATSKIVALAKNAAHEEDQNEIMANANPPQTVESLVWEEDYRAGGHPSDVGNESKAEIEMEYTEGLVLLPGQETESSISLGDFNASQMPFSTPEDIPNLSSIFGNGWFDQQPNHAGLKTPGADFNKSGLEETLAVKVVESTLRIAYLALLDEKDSLANLQRQIFRFSLMFHSREELLFNMRWFLGPGHSSLPVLGQASFEVNFNDSLNFGIGASSVLHPFVDMSALEEVQKEPSRSTILNAADVESYLRSFGASRIDQTTVQIEIRDPDAMNTDQGMSKGISEETPTDETQGKGFNLGEEADELILRELERNFTSNEISLLEGFTSSSLSELPDLAPTQSDEQASPSASRQLVTLDVPLLLKNLASVSMCLGKGPGYLKRDVDKAIVSSVSQMVASY